VGVEPTIRSAKGRIGGFEGRDSHRTIFASSRIIDHHDWASDLLVLILRWELHFRARQCRFAAGRGTFPYLFMAFCEMREARSQL
jgi:hypothetical protein